MSPVATAPPGVRSSEVVNLCFHGVGAPGRTLEPGEDAYWISVETFHEILDAVQAWGSVSLSFDDGNTSDYTEALPALVERGLTATFFPLAGRLDERGSLTRGQLREISDAGMAVGTHGMHHDVWRRLGPDELRRELVDAPRLLEDVTGRPVTEAACPLGRYDRGLLTEARRLGLRHVHTSDRRVVRPESWLQHRFSVQTPDTALTLRAAVASAASTPRRVRLAAVGLVKSRR